LCAFRYKSLSRAADEEAETQGHCGAGCNDAEAGMVGVQRDCSALGLVAE
jgi:hypothetical protein